MYGQTGCGKTFTMMGLRELTDGSKKLMPKALESSSEEGSGSSEEEAPVEAKETKSAKGTQGILISSLKEIFREAEEEVTLLLFFK